MWVGRQPGQKKKAPDPETDEVLASELRSLAETAGLKVDDFLVAHGNFGSWLMKLTGANGNERLIWDGKNKELRYETEIHTANWETCASGNPESTERDALIACAKTLLVAAEDA